MSDAYTYVADALVQLRADELDAVWTVIAEEAEALDRCFTQGEAVDVPGVMARALASLPEDLMWEFGAAENGHRLAITSEAAAELRPLARALLTRAPEVPNFVFTDARPEEDLSTVQQLLEARQRRPFALATVVPSLDDNRSIALDVTTTGDLSDATLEAERLFSILMGEEVERTWLGTIDTGPAKRSWFRKSAHLDLATLKSDIDGLIAQARRECPPLRYRDVDRTNVEVSVMQLQGGGGRWPREDAFVFASQDPQLESALLQKPFFASARFSRFGETFVIVQIAREDARFDEVDARYEIEDAVHASLVDAESGGVVGGAHGAGHVYVTVALEDVRAAMSILKSTLQEAEVPKAAWVHFVDQGLQDMSVPIWPDTPKPRQH
jgi:hypothetical protein